MKPIKVGKARTGTRKRPAQKKPKVKAAPAPVRAPKPVPAPASRKRKITPDQAFEAFGRLKSIKNGAAEFGVSSPTFSYNLRQHPQYEKVYNTVTDEQRAEMKRLHGEGYGLTAIAKQLSLPMSTTRGALVAMLGEGADFTDRRHKIAREAKAAARPEKVKRGPKKVQKPVLPPRPADFGARAWPVLGEGDLPDRFNDKARGYFNADVFGEKQHYSTCLI